MQRRNLHLLQNWIFLVISLTTFSTGLVLFICFHIGQGAFNSTALGAGRLFWLNVHRISALVVVAVVVIHLDRHWRVFRSRLTNIFTRRRKKPINSEVVMYIVFFVSTLTAFVAWLVLEGSSPLFGPAVIGRVGATRHPWIDTHNLVSLVSLVLIVHHIWHRWRLMLRRRRPVVSVRKAVRSGSLRNKSFY